MSAANPPGGVGLDLETRHHEIRVVLEHGELERAWNLCQQLLAEYPGDLTGHALMGDIYAARRQWGEAADWYALAEQMGGGHEISERRAAAQAMLRQAFRPQTPVAEVQDLHRRRVVVQSIFVAAGIVAMLALVIALAAVFSRPAATTGGRPSAPTPEFASPGALNTGRTAPRPATATALATGTASRRPGAAAGTSRAAPSGAARYLNAPATDEDFAIASAVSALTWPDGTSMAGNVAVMQDPYQGYCVITFRLPDTLPTGRLYDTVLEQGYRVVLAALSTDPRVDGVTLRALYTVQPSRQQAQTVQVFRANTARRVVTAFAQQHPNPDAASLAQQVYAAPWWNPAIPQG